MTSAGGPRRPADPDAGMRRNPGSHDPATVPLPPRTSIQGASLTTMTQRSLTVALAALFFLAGCDQDRRLSTSSPEALAAYTEGVSLWEKFYYPEATAAFLQALKADSSFAMAWTRLAVISFGADNEADAHTRIDQALRLAPRASEREQLFIRMWDRRIHFANDEAGRLVDSLLARYPDDAEAWVFKGGLLEMDRKFDAAIDAYASAVQADSAYAPAVMMLGYAYSGLNEQDKALAQMERYIRLVPGAADPRASYADLLLRVGRYDEALEQYRQSLTLKPDYWYAINQIGAIYTIQGRLNDAGRQFEHGYHVFPSGAASQAALIATRAGLAFSRGDYEGATRLYTSALQTDTTNLNAAYGLVYTLAKSKRFRDGDAVVAQIAGELQRRNLMGSQIMTNFHLMKAYLAMEEGRLDSARSQCIDALDGSAPLVRPSVFRMLAEIHLREKAYDDALDACGEALGVNANWPSGLLTLVRIYSAKRDPVMTAEIGNRLLTLWKNADPDFQDLIELKRLLAGGHPSV
jgi:tetratricopeptide (TPR) repeat protein